MRRVIVNIDRLVLRGVRYEDRHAAAARLRRELAELLASGELVDRIAAGGDIARLRLEAEPLRAVQAPSALASGAVRAVGRKPARETAGTGRGQTNGGSSDE